MDQLVSHVVPIVILVLGLSYLSAPGYWIRYAREVLEAPHRFLMPALGLLVSGLVIVVARNWWHPSLGVVVTIFGWLLVVKGALFLLLPGWSSRFSGWSDNAMRQALRLGGVVLTILGAVLTWAAWSARV